MRYYYTISFYGESDFGPDRHVAHIVKKNSLFSNKVIRVSSVWSKHCIHGGDVVDYYTTAEELEKDLNLVYLPKLKAAKKVDKKNLKAENRRLKYLGRV